MVEWVQAKPRLLEVGEAPIEPLGPVFAEQINPLAAGQTQRPLTVALDVVNGRNMEDAGVGDLARTLDDGDIDAVAAFLNAAQ